MNEAVNQENYNLNGLISVERYSDYHKLLRVNSIRSQIFQQLQNKGKSQSGEVIIG